MRRIIALSLVILTLLMACDSPPPPASTPTVVAVPPSTPPLPPLRPTVTVTPAIPPPRSNITRADYNAALAKWQRQGISDYEISVYQLSLGVNGVYRLRVQGDQVTVLSNPYIYPQYPTATPYPAHDSERIYTVAGLFAEIDEDLTVVERGKSYGGFVYWVLFDPVLGYPNSIGSGCEGPIYPGAYECASDTGVSKIVRSLTVLAPTLTATPVTGP